MPETLTAAEIAQLARFDEYWRVIFAGDNAKMVRSLAKRGYLDKMFSEYSNPQDPIPGRGRWRRGVWTYMLNARGEEQL